MPDPGHIEAPLRGIMYQRQCLSTCETSTRNQAKGNSKKHTRYAQSVKYNLRDAPLGLYTELSTEHWGLGLSWSVAEIVALAVSGSRELGRDVDGVSKTPVIWGKWVQQDTLCWLRDFLGHSQPLTSCVFAARNSSFAVTLPLRALHQV